MSYIPPITRIEPSKGGWRLQWTDIWDYRDLLYFLVLRNVKILYKQTVLGFGWAILNPALQMILFTLIFGYLGEIPSDGVPYAVFSYAALIPWTYFSQSLSSATNSLISSTGIISKVYFPRIIIPMAAVIAKLLDYVIAFVFMGVLMVIYDIVPNWNLLWIPLLSVILILSSAGIGFWMSAMAIRYRDVKFTIVYIIQIMMYLAPVVWPMSLLESKIGPTAMKIYSVYPLAGVIEGFRSAILGTVEMPYIYILNGGISALILFVTGWMYFQRVEKYFADVA
jgi:lipopolysaccharide transport system permease protein